MKRTNLWWLVATGIVVLLVVLLAGCIPSLPGTNTAICIFCTESSSTGHGGSGAAAGESPEMPALPVGLPGLPAPADGAPATAPAPSAEAEGDDPAPEAKAPDLALRLRDFVPDASPTEAGDPELAQTLRDAEGFCASPCVGPNGHLHIGYGHLITRAEGDRLLARDMAVAAETAERVVGPAWAALSKRRRQVLIEMAYMLGDTRLRKFGEMLPALRAGDYARAADEIADSALMPPTRVARLAAAMREG